MGDEDDVGLPQKGLNMIIKDALPDVRIANESRELLNHCCVEFVKHIAREAQRISSDDQRKTIYHEHVQKALLNLGFPPDYVEAADRVLDECKEAREKKLRRKNSRLDKCGIPEEELFRMQQALFRQDATATSEATGMFPAMPSEAADLGNPMLQQSLANTPSTSAAAGLMVSAPPSTSVDDEDYDV